MVLIASVAMASGCGGNAKQDEHAGEAAETHAEAEETHESGEIVFTPEQAERAGLKTETVTAGAFSEIIRASGEILAAQGDEMTVVATSSGVVSFAKSNLTEGAAVGRGERLFVISSKDMSEGDPVAKARAEYDAAKKEFDRAEKLAADKIVSERELEQARLRFETARAAYEGVAGNSGKSGVAVTAPRGGYIKTCRVSPGDYVSAGEAMAVVTQARRLRLRAEVSERYYGSLPSVRNAVFRLSYEPEAVNLADLHGRLISYGKSSGGDSHYVPVTFEFDNAGNIVPGSFAEVYLEATPRQNVITVPVGALTEEQGVNYVYVRLDEECYEKREVRAGSGNGERIEVKSGLAEGENVVTAGVYQVKLAASSGVIPEGHSHSH